MHSAGNRVPGKRMSLQCAIRLPSHRLPRKSHLFTVDSRGKGGGRGARDERENLSPSPREIFLPSSFLPSFFFLAFSRLGRAFTHVVLIVAGITQHSKENTYAIKGCYRFRISARRPYTAYRPRRMHVEGSPGLARASPSHA